jgi:hypothetical protein
MDEKQFITRIQDKVMLLMRQISDQRPLAEIFAMIHDRNMDERLFLELLKHKIDTGVPPPEISRFIEHRRMDEKPFLELLKHKVDQAVVAPLGPLQEISSLIGSRLANL